MASPEAPQTLRTLLTLAWPIVLARATQAVVGFSDALMVAPLGEDTLAAVTTGATNVLTFVLLPMGTMFILQSFSAQLRGRGELETAHRYAVYGLLLAALAGLFAAAFIPFLEPILAALHFAPAVHSQMSGYVAIRLLSIAAVVGIEALGNWYGGLGNTRIAMIAGITIMVLNVFGNYLLIQPRFGLPGYGAAGSAWASTVSSWLGFLLIFVLFVRGYGHGLTVGRFRFRWSELARLLRFGLPSGVNWFLEFAAFALFINVIVGHLGTTVLAAFNVVFQINSISFMPALGVASAGAILVGENIGQGHKQRVWPLVRLTLSVTCAWMASVGLVYVVFPEPLIGLFEAESAPSPELMAVGATMLRLCGLWQLVDAVGLTLTEALRAAGDTAWPMTARILLAWLVFTPVSWAAIYWWHGGVVTAMVCVIAYITALAVILSARFATGRWKTIELIGEPEIAPLEPN